MNKNDHHEEKSLLVSSPSTTPTNPEAQNVVCPLRGIPTAPLQSTPHMHNTLTTFDFAPGISLRSINREGEPWFLVSDVCQALGISNPSQAVQKLDQDEKALTSMNTPGGRQQLLIVDESGLNTLVLRSRKPEAAAFRKWITKTVLPALRRDGVYIVGQEKPITDADTLPELLAQIAAIQAKVDAINADKLRRWYRHDEEKQARRNGFRLLRGRAPL